MSEDLASIVDRIQEKRQKKAEFIEKNSDQEAEYMKALNGIAGSKNGKYFLKVLIQYIDLYGFKASLEPRDMFVNRGKKQVYLEMIRPYLKQSVRKEIE